MVKCIHKGRGLRGNTQSSGNCLKQNLEKTSPYEIRMLPARSLVFSYCCSLARFSSLV